MRVVLLLLSLSGCERALEIPLAPAAAADAADASDAPDAADAVDAADAADASGVKCGTEVCPVGYRCDSCLTPEGAVPACLPPDAAC